MTTNTKGGVMKRKGSRRLIARLGLALAVAAIAVPGAQAVTMNSDNESGGVARLYADDLHQSFPVATLAPSNVRTDASAVVPFAPGANVLTDSASFQGQPVSYPGANVITDSASLQGPPPKPVSNLISDVRTDAASTVPLTDARHSALLRHRMLGRPPAEPASSPLPSTDSPGIDWGVAAIGAALGMLGLMLLFGIVFYAGRHNRGRLAAT